MLNVDKIENEIQLNKLLDRYEILTPLDKRNKVFLVKDNDLNEIFVQKQCTVVDQDLYMTLRQHPVYGVPAIYEIIQCYDGELLLIEEYIHGNNLEHMLMKDGIYTEQEVVNYMLQLCQILRYVHGMSPAVVHRDIKPSNIIVTNDSRIFLVDFNTSRTYKQGGNLDTTAFVTQHFSAPELYGFGQSDQRSDIYSIGATMHYLLTGGFLHESVYDGILNPIIRKCTMMAPKDRYQSVNELAGDLNKLYQSLNRSSEQSFDGSLNHISEQLFNESSDQLSNGIKFGRDEENYATMSGSSGSSRSERRNDMIEGFTLHGSYAIPGFRTKKWWKMILAVLVYLLVADICFTMDIETSIKPPLDILDIWMERICTYVFFMVSIFMIFNYKGCQNFLPFSRKTKHKVITVTAGIFVTFAMLMGVMVLEVTVLGMF